MCHFSPLTDPGTNVRDDGDDYVHTDDYEYDYDYDARPPILRSSYAPRSDEGRGESIDLRPPRATTPHAPPFSSPTLGSTE